jgi:hypothetical protein
MIRHGLLFLLTTISRLTTIEINSGAACPFHDWEKEDNPELMQLVQRPRDGTKQPIV